MRGFSLVGALLLTLVLLGAVGVMAGVQLQSSFTKAQTRRDFQALYDAVVKARSDAMRDDSCVQVYAITAQNGPELRIRTLDDKECGISATTRTSVPNPIHRPPENDALVLEMSRRLAFTLEKPFTFLPDGGLTGVFAACISVALTSGESAKPGWLNLYISRAGALWADESKTRPGAWCEERWR